METPAPMEPMEAIRHARNAARRAAPAFTAVTMLGILACTSSSDDGPQGGSPGTTGGVSASGSTSTGGSGTGGSSTGGSSTGGSTTGGSTAAGSGGMASGGASDKGSGGKGTAGASGAAAGSGGSVASGGSQPGGKGGASTGGAAGKAGSSSGGSGGAMASTGCGAAAAPKSGRLSIDVGGTMREYILAVPDNYDASKPYRLIFGWHPLGGSAQQVAGNGNSGYYGLQSQAKGSAIFVAPEGLPFNGNSLGWGNSNGQDIAFLEAMLARFRAELCIDENRIFSTGFSFGGMFSFAAGCSPGGMMRAIAPQAGNIQVSRCEDGDRPVAVMGFHGVDDTVVDIDGGRDGRDVFVERNGCGQATMPVTPSWCDGLSASNQPCECLSYQDCDPGYPVIWCEFKAGHTPAPNSGATIWNFFAQF
jgi:polyhydroxybutyrate depolymerase